jgi:viroplasmin and RNaseH domain-containing protein
MKKPRIQYRLDIEDFSTDIEILKAVKNILKLNKDREFTQSVMGSDSMYEITGKGFQILISNCNNIEN